MRIADESRSGVRPFPFFRAGVRADPVAHAKPVLVLDGVSKFF